MAVFLFSVRRLATDHPSKFLHSLSGVITVRPRPVLVEVGDYEAFSLADHPSPQRFRIQPYLPWLVAQVHDSLAF